MKIEVVNSFRNYRRGQVFDWDESTVRLLVDRGLVKVIEEKSVDEPEQNKAILHARRKKAVTVGG